MKQADIFINNCFCGILTEDEEGYHFAYDQAYLASPEATPLSPTMPLTDQLYEREMMFPVFDGLIPEGWLLDIAPSSWKIDPRDWMSLLIACCKDCIGNISVTPHHE
ncbi:MAG: HipA N-terminal domain-containing protein [Bacteroidales bacterium]|nr:HipA N-terminal domain-containing protein [Bacteroidales bacterium]